MNPDGPTQIQTSSPPSTGRLLRDGEFVWDGAASTPAPTRGRYSRSGLEPDDVERLARELPDPGLRLQDLADRIGVSRNQLSQVLQQGIGESTPLLGARRTLGSRA